MSYSSNFGGVLSASCDLNGLSTIAQYRSAISNYKFPSDVEWILGGGWAMSVFGAGESQPKDY